MKEVNFIQLFTELLYSFAHSREREYNRWVLNERGVLWLIDFMN